MRTFDIDECAEFLKINRVTASELAAVGELPGAKIGRAWVFLEDDLVEYLRNKVRQQQRERQGEAKLNLIEQKVKPSFPTIRKTGKTSRTPIPELPELVGQM